MTRLKLGVAVLVVAAALVVPAVAAEPATGSIDGPSDVSPGETVTYTFPVTNTGSESSGYIVDVSLPDGWSVVERYDASDDGRDTPRTARHRLDDLSTGRCGALKATRLLGPASIPPAPTRRDRSAPGADR